MNEIIRPFIYDIIYHIQSYIMKFPVYNSTETNHKVTGSQYHYFKLTSIKRLYCFFYLNNQELTLVEL